MKSIEECLDAIIDDSYALSITLNEFVDADVQESVLRGLYNSYKLGDFKSVEIFGKSLAQAIDDAIIDRARTAKEASRTPYDNDMRGDKADYARAV
jgi:hypothetical protein